MAKFHRPREPDSGRDSERGDSERAGAAGRVSTRGVSTRGALGAGVGAGVSVGRGAGLLITGAGAGAMTRGDGVMSVGLPERLKEPRFSLSMRRDSSRRTSTLGRLNTGAGAGESFRVGADSITTRLRPGDDGVEGLPRLLKFGALPDEGDCGVGELHVEVGRAERGVEGLWLSGGSPPTTCCDGV